MGTMELKRQTSTDWPKLDAVQRRGDEVLTEPYKSQYTGFPCSVRETYRSPLFDLKMEKGELSVKIEGKFP